MVSVAIGRISPQKKTNVQFEQTKIKIRTRCGVILIHPHVRGASSTRSQTLRKGEVLGGQQMEVQVGSTVLPRGVLFPRAAAKTGAAHTGVQHIGDQILARLHLVAVLQHQRSGLQRELLEVFDRVDGGQEVLDAGQGGVLVRAAVRARVVVVRSLRGGHGMDRLCGGVTVVAHPSGNAFFVCGVGRSIVGELVQFGAELVDDLENVLVSLQLPHIQQGLGHADAVLGSIQLLKREGLAGGGREGVHDLTVGGDLEGFG